MRLPDYGLVNASNGPNGNDKEAVFKPQNKLVLYNTDRLGILIAIAHTYE